jgi:hypothetical protein
LEAVYLYPLPSLLSHVPSTSVNLDVDTQLKDRNTIINLLKEHLQVSSKLHEASAIAVRKNLKLYAFHNSHWFSIPDLIWGQLYNCWEGLHSWRLQAASTWALPFPALITRIFLEKGVEPRAGDYTDSTFPQFSLLQWNQSISHMCQQASAMAPDAMEEDQVGDNVKEEATQHVTTCFFFLYTNIKQVIAVARLCVAQPTYGTCPIICT